MLRRSQRSVSFGVAVPVAAAVLMCAGLARAQAGGDDDRGGGAVPGGSSGAAVRPTKPDDTAAKKKPVIVMPKLVHFQEAPYPPEALQQGLTADVVLGLTIDATGKVTQADVLQPAGHGFDEAAQAAALQFTFEPATVDGKAAPVKIQYKYSFTLKEAPPPAKPPPPPKTGNLGGRIDIAGTDTPLAGATLVVTFPDGSEHRLVTDAQGRWGLEKLQPGSYAIKNRGRGLRRGAAEGRRHRG